jgi:cytochrome c oxidase subunit 4
MSDVQVAGEHRPDEHVHPGPVEYIHVAIFLALVTAGEVAVFYLSALRPVLAPTLIGMAVIKFGTVAAYFMHLKFDTHIFRRFLIMGIGLALIVFFVTVVMFAHYGA